MIEFKEYSLEFVEQFAEIRNNPKIFDNGYDHIPYPFTISDAFDFIDKQINNKPAHRFFIFWNDELAGEIGITIKEDIFRLSAEIGYFIGERFWGNGLATAAIRYMTQYAFDHLNVIRIEAGVFEFNKASMKVLEKNGFHLESVKKKAVVKNDRIIDDYVWVKLKE